MMLDVVAHGILTILAICVFIYTAELWLKGRLYLRVRQCLSWGAFAVAVFLIVWSLLRVAWYWGNWSTP